MSRYIDADKIRYTDLSEGRGVCWVTFMDWIKEMPTADVRENVRGEWRTTYFDHVAMGERPKILYCSVCNQCIAYPTNYCPNCGAQMVRGEK